MHLDRRRLLAVLGALATPGPLLAGDGGRLGPPEPMDFERLVDRARLSSLSPYVPRAIPSPEILDRIDYDRHNEIVARVELYPGAAEAVTPFHLGTQFRRPVRIFALRDGVARRFEYRSSDFAFPVDNPAGKLPDGAGFAGFRVHDDADVEGRLDWLAFLGASYFRSSGDLGQYGISARGISVDVARSRPPFVEEFPDFTDFYVGPVEDGKVRVLATLDGPSVSGAYAFDATRRPGTTIDVEMALFLRKDVDRLGIAPMSSMFWYGKPIRWDGDDQRLEVHDSDGLAMWTGAGERLWRPLNNPPGVNVSAFSDENPRRFGLMQRERRKAIYQDPVRFEDRPDLVVEPKGDWGKGSVQLVEIHGFREYDDNVVCQWVPEKPARAGDAMRLAYALRWSADGGFPGDLARCVGTRMDLGETRETMRQPAGDYEVWRGIVVDFEGAALARSDIASAIPNLTMSKGRCRRVEIRRGPDGRADWWRVWMDVGSDDAAPVEMRMTIQDGGGRALSEVWLYQYHPLQFWRGMDLEAKAPPHVARPDAVTVTARDATPVVVPSIAADGDGPVFVTGPLGERRP